MLERGYGVRIYESKLLTLYNLILYTSIKAHHFVSIIRTLITIRRTYNLPFKLN